TDHPRRPRAPDSQLAAYCLSALRKAPIAPSSVRQISANCRPYAVSSQLPESSQNRLPVGGLVPDGVDDKFYERADAHIHLSNEQLEDIDRVRASASMMYATTRFNAWVSARGVGSKEEM